MTQRTKALLVVAVVLAMGVVMVKLEIIDNLAAAREHGDVRVHEKALFLGPLFVLFGVFGLAVIPFARSARALRLHDLSSAMYAQDALLGRHAEA